MNEQYELNSKLIKTHLRKEFRQRAWLVKNLGVSASLVDKILLGHIPREDTLEALVTLLGVQRKDLLIPKKRRTG